MYLLTSNVICLKFVISILFNESLNLFTEKEPQSDSPPIFKLSYHSYQEHRN